MGRGRRRRRAGRVGEGQYSSIQVFIFSFRVPIVLVGNKRDLHMQRVVTFEMGKKLANEWNVSFIESSAKQNEVS